MEQFAEAREALHPAAARRRAERDRRRRALLRVERVELHDRRDPAGARRRGLMPADTLALRIEHKAPETRDEPSPLGHVWLEQGPSRAVLLTPSELEPGRTYPLITVLHGAGRQDEMLVKACRDEPDRRRAFFLVPRSLLPTWDLIASSERPDLDFLEYAYDLVYRRYPIDPARQALLGYSDGASYALSVGLSNPTLFRAVMAWAAGFIALEPTLRPRRRAQARRPPRVRHPRPALPVRARGAADAREPGARRLHRAVSRRRGRPPLAVARLPARGTGLVLRLCPHDQQPALVPADAGVPALAAHAALLAVHVLLHDGGARAAGLGLRLPEVDLLLHRDGDRGPVRRGRRSPGPALDARRSARSRARSAARSTCWAGASRRTRRPSSASPAGPRS